MMVLLMLLIDAGRDADAGRGDGAARPCVRALHCVALRCVALRERGLVCCLLWSSSPPESVSWLLLLFVVLVVLACLYCPYNALEVLLSYLASKVLLAALNLLPLCNLVPPISRATISCLVF